VTPTPDASVVDQKVEAAEQFPCTLDQFPAVRGFCNVRGDGVDVPTLALQIPRQFVERSLIPGRQDEASAGFRQPVGGGLADYP
jgi:hypothetical protein